jgi:hypothetical protein
MVISPPKLREERHIIDSGRRCRSKIAKLSQPAGASVDEIVADDG